jgi:CubicO group peptidase (beta-lactamase class C family)
MISSRRRLRNHFSAPLLAAALVSIAVSTSRLPAQSSGDSNPRAARVERSILPSTRVSTRKYTPATIAERMKHFGVPAVSVALIDSGRIVWARAYGFADVAGSRAATPATLFQAASMSKPVASVAALQLVQDGRLALDTPVNASLRTWQVPDNAFTDGHPVTLRGLLTHTAGLTVHGFPGYAADAPLPTVVQVLNGTAPANTRAVRVDTTPGATWRYSGGGMTVMQQLIEDVSGQPFPALLRARVLEPAGMRASTYEQPLPASRALEAATGYQSNGSAVAGRYHTYPEMAAAGLWTTPSDLARWVLAMQHSLAGAKGALLSRETASKMITPGLGGWGLGVQIAGAGDSLVFTHGGANEGFRAIFVGFANRPQGAVVMTNSDAGSAIADEIIRALAVEYHWPGFARREIAAIPMSAAALQEYAGTYAQEGGLRVKIDAEGDRLWLTLPDGRRWELVFTGADQVTSPDIDVTEHFERGANREVAAFSIGEQRLARVP